VPLNAGVLIIGSLFWDPDPVRVAWRDARLAMDSAETVTVPIRYGRLSSSRGKSYTMVFSRLCQPGQAKLLPCVQMISSLQDLIREAECLWKAEQPGSKSQSDRGKLGLRRAAVQSKAKNSRGVFKRMGTTFSPRAQLWECIAKPGGRHPREQRRIAAD
jgi:hypothetical protein